MLKTLNIFRFPNLTCHRSAAVSEVWHCENLGPRRKHLKKNIWFSSSSICYNLLPDPGARVCFTNSVVIHSFINSLTESPTALRRRQAQTVRNGASSHIIDYRIKVKGILNLKERKKEEKIVFTCICITSAVQRLLYCTAERCTLLSGSVLCSVILFLYCVLYCTMLICFRFGINSFTVLYCTVLYCTAL